MFHQDTRARQIAGAALLVLRDDDVNAARWLAGRPYCNPRDAGCRVVYRTLSQRVWELETRGERAGNAIIRLANTVRDYIEPESLWRVYPSGDIGNAYMCADNRCHWSLPSFHAEDVAYQTALSTHDCRAEYDDQRITLAALIADWPNWDEDRAAWRQRVEQDWIPRIEASLPGHVSFNVPKYVARVRRTFVPWHGPS